MQRRHTSPYRLHYRTLQVRGRALYRDTSTSSKTISTACTLWNNSTAIQTWPHITYITKFHGGTYCWIWGIIFTCLTELRRYWDKIFGPSVYSYYRYSLFFFKGELKIRIQYDMKQRHSVYQWSCSCQEVEQSCSHHLRTIGFNSCRALYVARKRWENS